MSSLPVTLEESFLEMEAGVVSRLHLGAFFTEASQNTICLGRQWVPCAVAPHGVITKQATESYTLEPLRTLATSHPKGRTGNGAVESLRL